MKVKSLLLSVLILISCMLAFSACADDPYKDYVSTGIQVKSIPFNYDDEELYKFGFNKAEIFSDYESYSVYNFDLNYNESYFELNDLIVFVVSACSSDEMEFGEILENEGKIYPLFYRKKIGTGQPVTDDFIIIPCYAEISKEAGYEAGEIIFRYK